MKQGKIDFVYLQRRMKRLSLTHYFAGWLLLMLLIVLLTLPDERPDPLDHIGFDTTRSSEMYFHNLRSYHYRQSEEAGDIFEVYRLKSLHDNEEVALLPLAIYKNWRSHEAFIRLDTAQKYPSWHAVVAENADSAFVIDRPDWSNESQFHFARALHRSMEGDARMALLPEPGDTLWLSQDERSALRVVLRDYFKLVNKL